MLGENDVRFREDSTGVYQAVISVTVSGDWRHADRFAVDMRPGYSVSATADVLP